MINSNTSSCKRCMKLLRLLTLDGLRNNRRVFARWVDTKSNFLADSLSRLDFKHFRRLGLQMNQYPDNVSAEIWPISRVW